MGSRTFSPRAVFCAHRQVESGAACAARFLDQGRSPGLPFRPKGAACVMKEEEIARVAKHNSFTGPGARGAFPKPCTVREERRLSRHFGLPRRPCAHDDQLESFHCVRDRAGLEEWGLSTRRSASQSASGARRERGLSNHEHFSSAHYRAHRCRRSANY